VRACKYGAVNKSQVMRSTSGGGGGGGGGAGVCARIE
jgi:hypothetical protein